MTLLITGAGGQLGHELVAAARTAGVRAIGLTRADLDVTDRSAVLEAVRVVLSGGSPDELTAVLHTAAYTRVDAAESNPEGAFRANRDGAANVAEASAKVGAPMIHFSTDYVFSGESARPWREEDPTGPLNVYGASKVAGEQEVIRLQPRHVILRTSWVFGAHGANFIRTILGLAMSQSELRIVGDQLGCPTPAADLARATLKIARIIGGYEGEEKCSKGPSPWGIYHLVGSPPVTWVEFARAVLEVAAATGDLARSPRLVPVSSEELNLPARRPSFSVLDCSRIEQRFGIEPPNWRPGLWEAVQAIEVEA